jgi:hypothetical protein
MTKCAQPPLGRGGNDKRDFRRIDKWPSEKTAADKRRRSPFKAAYNATLDLLEAELQHLYASDIVIQCEAQRSQIRNDGWLKSDARVEGPAVIVSFNSRKKSYGYPCDRFTDWKANLRAIALSLEALRAVDRIWRNHPWPAVPRLPAPGRRRIASGTQPRS